MRNPLAPQLIRTTISFDFLLIVSFFHCLFIFFEIALLSLVTQNITSSTGPSKTNLHNKLLARQSQQVVCTTISFDLLHIFIIIFFISFVYLLEIAILSWVNHNKTSSTEPSLSPSNTYSHNKPTYITSATIHLH